MTQANGTHVEILPPTPLNERLPDMARTDRLNKLFTNIETAMYSNSPTAPILLNKLKQELREQGVME